jgi:hypothetical protein
MSNVAQTHRLTYNSIARNSDILVVLRQFFLDFEQILGNIFAFSPGVVLTALCRSWNNQRLVL